MAGAVFLIFRALSSSAHGEVMPPSKKIVEFQPFRGEESVTFSAVGSKFTSATLINLNKNVNGWYVLELTGAEGKKILNLENPDSANQIFYLANDFNVGIMIRDRGREFPCPLWQEGLVWNTNDIALNLPYSVGCGGKVFIRNQVEGNKTTKEWFVSWARKNLSFGENIATFVKTSLLQDQYLIAPQAGEVSSLNGPATFVAASPENGPMPAKVAAGSSGSAVLLDRKGLGIKLEQEGDSIVAGQWLRTAAYPGVYVSLITPSLAIPQADGPIEASVQQPSPKVPPAAGAEKTEGTAGVFQVAFDLQKYRVGFLLGTEHPSVEWSDRILAQAYDKKRAGPDGFSTIQPLVANGAVNPDIAARVVSVFTGGFKRGHGAFRWGDLATRNFGSHYGFIENGVVFSSLQPGLATVAIDNSGNLTIGTWKEEDNEKLGQIRYARQNGVAIIDWDPKLQRVAAGPLVKNWGAGNWSGSIDSRLRSVRAGICLQESAHGKFLIYSYFSGATPESMAKVYLAYGCTYAMHLDMNALEHTYLSLVSGANSEFLIQDMSVLDKEFEGRKLKRFIDFPDNRDFFYIAPRNQ